MTAADSMAFTIDELVVPDNIRSSDAADFIGMAFVRSSVEAELRGDAHAAEDTFTAEEMLPAWKDETSPMWGLVARVEGRVVGRASLALPLDAGECWASVSVLPEFRNRGIGSNLYERLEAKARDATRTAIQNQTSFAAGIGGDTVHAPTGFGAVPLGLASTRFLQRNGFAVEQVGRLSGLSVPDETAALQELLAAATSTASGYSTVSWQGRTPVEWLDAMAMMRTRMSTDTPNAGLDSTEDVWTATRVRSFDDLLATSPRTMLTSIVQHDGTGDVAGYTELDVPPESDRPVEQVDTLVLRDHRGHGLGMLLKLENLRQLAERFPSNEVVETMNAEDNVHMIAINEAIGFSPVSFAARWRKSIG